MRFHEVRFKTANLESQIAFYEGSLEFPLLSRDEVSATFQAGATTLVWMLEPDFLGNYHFAFNIATNLLDDTHALLNVRVELLRGPDGNDRIHFEDWNADSLYFFDPDGNIVEFIARHTLPDEAARVLSLSEVGIVTDDVRATTEALSDCYGITPYRGATSEEFVALGDEAGMFIIVKSGRPWFPTNVAALYAQVDFRAPSLDGE